MVMGGECGGTRGVSETVVVSRKTYFLQTVGVDGGPFHLNNVLEFGKKAAKWLHGGQKINRSCL